VKVIIAGSRDITDFKIVNDVVQPFIKNISEIVCGCAKGVDQLGWEIGEISDTPVKMFPADWKKHGKAAGPIRNRQMAEYADAAIVIHNGSRGSLNMIEQMKKLKQTSL
jgi:hypothetical protein